jgi:hypothetical protein
MMHEAVDHHRGSRDAGSIIGSEIANQLGNFFRFADAAREESPAAGSTSSRYHKTCLAFRIVLSRARLALSLMIPGEFSELHH